MEYKVLKIVESDINVLNERDALTAARRVSQAMENIGLNSSAVAMATQNAFEEWNAATNEGLFVQDPGIRVSFYPNKEAPSMMTLYRPGPVDENSPDDRKMLARIALAPSLPTDFNVGLASDYLGENLPFGVVWDLEKATEDMESGIRPVYKPETLGVVETLKIMAK